MVVQNILVTLGTLGAAWCWTKTLSVLQQRKKLKRDSVRKVIHMTAAPLMMVTWPLYTTAWHARVLASVVPLAFGVRMARSSEKDPLCESVSRSGDPIESRFGPASYCASVGTIILCFWRGNPVTYTTLAMLVYGDAFANIVGSAVKGPRWPLVNTKKSIAGSLGFVFAGSFATKAMLRFAHVTRMCSQTVTLSNIFIVALGGALAEALLPMQDNFVVPAASALVAKFLL